MYLLARPDSASRIPMQDVCRPARGMRRLLRRVPYGSRTARTLPKTRFQMRLSDTRDLARVYVTQNAGGCERTECLWAELPEFVLSMRERVQRGAGEGDYDSMSGL